MAAKRKQKTLEQILPLAQEIYIHLLPRELKIQNGERGSLNSYTPFNLINEKFATKRQELISALIGIPGGDRAIGCIVGMGVADAVGHPFEFLPVCDKPTEYIFNLGNYSKENNTFRLERGQWTDDASMGLCIADSLILKQGLFDGSDQRIRFWNWWNLGYNNAFKNDPHRCDSVGLGGNISKSLYSMKNGVKPDPVFQKTGSDAGNGSLMRLAPIPIAFHRNKDDVHRLAMESSWTTHPGPIAAHACAFMGNIIASAIMHEGDIGDTKVFIEKNVDNFMNNYLQDSDGKELTGPGFDELRKMLLSKEPNESKEVNWNWRGTKLQIEKALTNRGSKYNGYPVSAGYFGAFSMDGLALALHCVYNTDNFEDALTKCVNFCGDADSTGSMAGQMAGAIYGYKSINKLYINNLNKWDDENFALRGALLYCLPYCKDQKMPMVIKNTENAGISQKESKE